MSNDFASVDYKFTPSQFIIDGQMMVVPLGGNASLGGIGLAGILGVMLNLIIPKGDDQ